MPRRTDIKSILIIGSGPIIIGQACEFDYSGSQACKALKQEGYRVVLVNSNPATIMTDPDMADRTYIEPITLKVLERIIQRERPDALLPTLGGQTGLNLAVELHRKGILREHGVELIGAKFDAIEKAEDRELFKAAMRRIGLEVLRSCHVSSVEAALEFAGEVGYPVVIRPSFTLGGTGGGIAYGENELREITDSGISHSPIREVLVEESAIGWKEYELEVMRDRADNVVVICSIENFDPMGVHTGDSITVAPAQTLTDKEYQAMRDAAIAIIREIGVETGGSNIQFAVNPHNGRMVVVEMNPRVSRSSALASKATGFPIAKIAAKLAVGYTLDELPNDITLKTPACFEPTIDYCVVKIPRWDFAKFPGADCTLTTQMKSVGEVMAIGRTFKEALQKAVRSLEQDRFGLGSDKEDALGVRFGPMPNPAALGQRVSEREKETFLEEIRSRLSVSNPDRIFYLRYAFSMGMDVDEVYSLTKIDKWFLYNIRALLDCEFEIRSRLSGASTQQDALEKLGPDLIREAKRCGFSDRQLAHLARAEELSVRRYRLSHGIRPVFKLVDTCAAEFQAYTPYYYSTYESEDESRVSDKRKVMILGGGPNRVGQGIEFDYCCVQAALALRDDGCEVIMVNCNPETVSTDYDISDKLYFEPLTLEDVLNICDSESPDGLILQFGGQTPLKLALALEAQGLTILGTSPYSIDLAEDREKFAAVLRRLGLRQPPNGIGRSLEEAKKIARLIGYPVLVRPSYVLGGRAMEVVYDEETLAGYIERAVEVSPERPILIDKFVEGATEVDVDAVSDGRITVVGGVMEHIEQAGIHSGDSACSLPPFSLSAECISEIKEQTRLLAEALGVIGLINIQFAVKDGIVYVLEANPRASRTVPFVSKVTGIPLAKVATRVMLGKTLAELGLTRDPSPRHVAVKEAVFPFIKFPGVDVILGPEMRSTGEVMGIDKSFGMAFAKSQMAAGTPLPLEGTVLITVADKDKTAIVPIAREFAALGFDLMSTSGTAQLLSSYHIPARRVNKIREGRPNIIDHIRSGEIDLIINTPGGQGQGPKRDGFYVRREALARNIPTITTVRGALAALEGIKTLRKQGLQVKSLQEHHAAHSL
ncbi:MAG: carbamoyl-phosphate synthase large subunit [Bacillota bacterium]